MFDLRNRKVVGASGESAASRYLRTKGGLKIIERNWRCPKGEIDLVARSPQGEIVIVEVKARAKILEDMWESVDWKKQERLVDLARWYLKSSGLSLDTPVRFDVVVVKPSGEIHHLPYAFTAQKEL